MFTAQEYDLGCTDSASTLFSYGGIPLDVVDRILLEQIENNLCIFHSYTTVAAAFGRFQTFII